MRLPAPAVVLWTAALMLSAPGVSAQPHTDDARIVLAAVMTGQGRPVVDVGLDDFVVTEGNAPRDILDVHIADYPLAIVLDDRAEVAVSLGAVEAAAKRFIQRVGERPVALFRLTNGAVPLVTLDDTRSAVLEQLAGLQPAEVSAIAPLDTIAQAAHLLKATGSPFSAVIVVAAAPVDASALVRGELLPQIIDSGAAVHVVQAQPPNPDNAGSPDAPDLMRLVADQTRGQFTAIFSSASYDAALDRLADRLAIELMIQYLVPAGQKAGDVRVGVRMPGARVVGLGVK